MRLKEDEHSHTHHSHHSPRSPPFPAQLASAITLLGYFGSPSCTTLHNDRSSCTARPARIPTWTASSPLPRRATKPAQGASVLTKRCIIVSRRNRNDYTIAGQRYRRGCRWARCETTISTHLAAASVVVGRTLIVACRTIGCCYRRRRGGGRSCGR